MYAEIWILIGIAVGFPAGALWAFVTHGTEKSGFTRSAWVVQVVSMRPLISEETRKVLLEVHKALTYSTYKGRKP